jgi:hypothetical protein
LTEAHEQLEVTRDGGYREDKDRSRMKESQNKSCDENNQVRGRSQVTAEEVAEEVV